MGHEKTYGVYGKRKGLILFRKHAIQYLKFQNMPLSVRTKILVQDDAENFLSLLEAYYAGIRGY